MRISINLLLGLILILAIFLRLWQLSSNPPGLTWDEVALGYNAYSILQTGKDEYGNLLPLNLKSFGDYKPALYAYLDIPFVALFGLNELAVRLPSVLFGVLGVLGIFLLVELLFNNRWLAILSAFFLAISPWHIQFSRPAFEANLALTLIIFGTYFFNKGFQKSKFFLWSSLFLGLSLFAYQGARIFVILIVLALIVIHKRDIKLNNQLKLSAAILVFFSIFLFASTFLSGQTQRLSTLNFFAYQRSQEELNLISKEDGISTNQFEFLLLHGEWWSYTRGLFERYLIYFSPKTLFIDGDYSQRHRVPGFGVLYYFSAILIPLGLYKLIKGNSLGPRFILIWLLLAPIPAVLSRDLISTLRALSMVVPWVIIEAAGLLLIIGKIRENRGYWLYLGLGIVASIIALNFLIFIDRYFIHAPIEYSKYWLYGYRQVFEDLGDLNKYSKVVITDKLGQPYIYYLFYTKYPPQKLHQQIILDQPSVDVGTVRKIDNIEFRNIFWPKDRGEKNSLFIGTIFELPDQDTKPFPEFKILKDVNNLDGEPALRVIETKP